MPPSAAPKPPAGEGGGGGEERGKSPSQKRARKRKAPALEEATERTYEWTEDCECSNEWTVFLCVLD